MFQLPKFKWWLKTPFLHNYPDWCDIFQEDDILDMISECEADEKEGKVFTGAGTRPRLPKVKLKGKSY